MQGERSLIDISDSELTPRARTLKRKQLARLKERTLVLIFFSILMMFSFG